MRSRTTFAALGAAILLTGCSTAPDAASPAQPSQPVAASTEVLAATLTGSLVTIDVDRGTVTPTLPGVSADADQLSVTPDGSTLYFAQASGCASQVYSVRVTGGRPALVADGTLPAVSPDGGRLAYVRQPRGPKAACPFPASQLAVVVRSLRTGAETAYPVAPQLVDSPGFRGIAHLSWAADGRRLAVSLVQPPSSAAPSLAVMDTNTAHYSASGAGVPVTGDPDAAHSWYNQGVFLPDGSLFVDRVCCATTPPTAPMSNLLWEVSTSGAVVRQVVTVGTRPVSSLAADPTGRQLLYLASNDLYVVVGDQRARPVTGVQTKLTAAAWVAAPPQNR